MLNGGASVHWPDAAQLASNQRMETTCPPHSTTVAWSQWSSCNACAVKSRSDSAEHNRTPRASVRSRAPASSTPNDQTCAHSESGPTQRDSAIGRVRSSMTRCAPASDPLWPHAPRLRQHWHDAPPARPILRASGHRPRVCPTPCATNRMHARVRSLPKAESGPCAPPLFQL
jgi:hypothetical protein